ncbi:MAG: NADPH-dependent oxidoreductase [Betaproteobacteria bacterium]|nr:NADPH-dependent oxidoreductase [Betaproteobacteria bacterium]
MTSPLFIVGIGGTLRDGSASEQALRLSLAHAASLGCQTQLFAGPDLHLGMYDPRRRQRSPAEHKLVEALRLADGVIVSTPSYHGGVSGLIKNAIDFIEDMNQDDRVYLSGRAVGCIVCAYGPQAMGTTLSSLRDIVHSLRGWPTPFGAAINVAQQPLGGPGQASDPSALQACETVALEVVQFAQQGRFAA